MDTARTLVSPEKHTKVPMDKLLNGFHAFEKKPS